MNFTVVEATSIADLINQVQLLLQTGMWEPRGEQIIIHERDHENDIQAHPVFFQAMEGK